MIHLKKKKKKESITAIQKCGHILRGFTCPVEPSHVHHGFMVGQLYILLGYHQLDLVPLFRLRVKKQNVNCVGFYAKNKNCTAKVIHD